MKEKMTIEPGSDLEFLRVSYGLDALQGAILEESIDVTLKPVVEAYIASIRAGDRFNQAVVQDFKTGWVAYRD